MIESTARARTEIHTVSIDPQDSHFIGTVLENSSELVSLEKDQDGNFPAPQNLPRRGKYKPENGSGADGLELTENQFIGSHNRSSHQGLYALDKAELFNLLVIPPYTTDAGIDDAVLSAAATYCENRRAFFIIDPPPDWTTASSAATGINNLGTSSKNAAVYFPRVAQDDVLNPGSNRTQPPSGILAGIYTRTDHQQGVWKAPAGTEATIHGIESLGTLLSSDQNTTLNTSSINCLRYFPNIGNVVWGSRTLSADPEWRLVPVRRTALFIEQSLYRGLRWTVFESNDATLWKAINNTVGAFLFTLWRQGAFQGAQPDHGYFVKCGFGETMTQRDLDAGRLIVELGFAPLKPAEFVILRIEQRLASP